MARTLALTFDDGPNPDGTVRVLELLERRNVTATFFIWGERAQQHPEVLRDILHAGHSLQPHCWEHVSHWTRRADAIAEDIDRVTDLLSTIGVPRPTLWRPPYGHALRSVTREIAAERGLALAGWTINPHDHAGHGAAEMLVEVRAQLAEQHEQAVLLAHDGHREQPRARMRRRDVADTVELVASLLDDEAIAFAPLAAGLEDSLEEGPPGTA